MRYDNKIDWQRAFIYMNPITENIQNLISSYYDKLRYDEAEFVNLAEKLESFNEEIYVIFNAGKKIYFHHFQDHTSMIISEYGAYNRGFRLESRGLLENVYIYESGTIYDIRNNSSFTINQLNNIRDFTSKIYAFVQNEYLKYILEYLNYKTGILFRILI